MVLVPMDSAGLRVIRALSVFGFDDAPRTYSHDIDDQWRHQAGHVVLVTPLDRHHWTDSGVTRRDGVTRLDTSPC